MEKTETLKEKNIDNPLKEVTDQAYYCIECGKCTGSCPMVELFPQHFHPHHFLSNLYLDPENALRDPALWLCASCYRCNKICPQGIEIPGILVIIRKVAIERNEMRGLNKALKMISEKIPFPASYFSVCLHPERIPLNHSIIEKLLSKGMKKRKEKQIPGPHNKVAVVGSGPAGLMAAYELKKKGYEVTVFESKAFAGGMFSSAIQEYRLPFKVIQEEITNLKSYGIEIKTNTRVGKDFSFNQLSKNGYKAIFLAIGANKFKRLNIEGERLDGVYDTLDYLSELKIGKRKMNATNVVVIGGGNKALDAALATVNNGANNITILYRRTKDEMPADIHELREAEAEGIKFQYLVTPLRYLGNKNQVQQVECIKMELGARDLTGRKRPVPVENSNFMINADQVIEAIGEEPESEILPDTIDVMDNGRIIVDPFTMETSLPGVFAGGDGVLGPATVAEAILAARRAAIGIDKYLRKK